MFNNFFDKIKQKVHLIVKKQSATIKQFIEFRIKSYKRVKLKKRLTDK